MKAMFANLTREDFFHNHTHASHRALVLAACDAVQIAVAAGDRGATQAWLVKLARLTSSRTHSQKWLLDPRPARAARRPRITT